MKKILTALLAGLVAAGSFATVSSAAIATLDEVPEGALTAYENGVVIWEGVDGFSNESYDKLFDYDETTKWCHQSPWSYVIWEVPEAVEITAYQIITANDNAEYPGRNPGSWIVYGCNDYNMEDGTGSWDVIHEVEDGTEFLEDTNYTPYTIELDAKAPAYKYFQWEIGSVVGGGVFQISGFNLIYDGQAAQEVKSEEEILAEKAIADAAAAAAELEALMAEGYVPAVELAPIEGIVTVSGTDGASDTEGAASLFDYDTGTKWCVINGAPAEVVFEMPSAVAITGYQLVTGGDSGDYPGRNPASWTLSGSNDGSAWTVIDTKTGDTTMMDKNVLAFDFNLDAAAPEYKFFKLEITEFGAAGTTMQLSGLNLIFDGAIAVAEETVVEETEAVVEETEAVVEETEAVVEETEAEVEETVEETEAVVEETEAEVVETVEVEPVEEEKAPQTFDAAIIAGVAAVVSLAGYAISKKH